VTSSYQSTIFTVGHSSRSKEEFLQLVNQANVACLIDVRRNPTSRRHPHFSSRLLEEFLDEHWLKYVWEGDALGGFRKPLLDSPHLALKDEHFRGYADYMASNAFREACDRVGLLAKEQVCALMWAEKHPADCHRQFIADYLLIHGIAVRHIVDLGVIKPHELQRIASVNKTSVTYDGGSSQLNLKL